MIPAKTHPKWPALVRGEISVTFKIFAGNMLLGRCQRTINRDQSPETLRACIDEAHAFFSKYESLYGAELRTVF